MKEILCAVTKTILCVEGTSRGRLQIAWVGHLPTNLSPGRRVLRSVQVAQFGGRILKIVRTVVSNFPPEELLRNGAKV